MWDYTQEGGSIRIFQGHTAPVRGLLWNPEVPYLLMSGSWDHTIRVWDTRDGACLDTILDHGGDVYGEDYIFILVMFLDRHFEFSMSFPNQVLLT